MPKMGTGRPRGRPPKNKDAGTGKPLAVSEMNLDDCPEAPGDLRKAGQFLWYQLWSSGGPALTDADTVLIHELCHIHDEKEFIRTALSTGVVPRVQQLTNKTLVSHPYITQLKELRQQFNSLVAALGVFSPADRARLGVLNAAEASAFDLLVEERKKRAEERRKNNDPEREG